jgi:hypothetical protein
MGVVIKRAAGYVWFKGMLEHEKQLALIEESAAGTEETANESLAAVLV